MTPLEIVEAREALHMKQVELARALGVSTNTVNRWERGHHPIPPWLWLAIEGLHHQQCNVGPRRVEGRGPDVGGR